MNSKKCYVVVKVYRARPSDCEENKYYRGRKLGETVLIMSDRDGQEWLK